MKNACFRLRSRLEAVIAAEGYFFVSIRWADELMKYKVTSSNKSRNFR